MPWYDYSLTPSGPKPLATIRLLHRTHFIHVNALVDSGADVSLFDIGQAELLGLDRNEAQQREIEVAGGGSIPVYEWPLGLLELRFEDQRIPYEGAFADFSNTDSLNILGRQDFFSRFIIQFWDARKLMNTDVSPDFARRPSGPRVLRENESEDMFQ